MVWLIALACLLLLGIIGFQIGPVRALFLFFGTLCGLILDNPLRPLTHPLLSLLGLHSQVWGLFVPQVIAFIVVVVVFCIAGNVVHHKVVVHFKYEADDARYFIWHRLYSRLGFCVGLFNGATWFVLLMVPFYVCGWFAQAAEAATDNAPISKGATFLADTRTSLQHLSLDRLLSAYDPVPANVYQGAGIVALIIHNPLIQSRLSHYPPCLTLAQRHPEFGSLANDLQFEEMYQSQPGLSQLLDYPSVQNIVTNSAITADLETFLGSDLSDFQNYLNTGESPKYDSETIVGEWAINPNATYAQLLKRGGLTPLQIRDNRSRMEAFVPGLSLLCTMDHEFIVKKGAPDGSQTVVATGTWKKDTDAYDVNLPGAKPPETEIEIDKGVRMFLPKDGDILVFDKE